MSVDINTPITEADMDALATLANTKLLPLVNAAIAAHTHAWQAASWTYRASGLIQSFSGQNSYDIPVAKTTGTHGLQIPQPNYNFDLTVENWADELNRIRGDAMEMIFASYPGGENLFLNAACLVSAPQVVSINDDDTYPHASHFVPGVLSASATYFKNVEFWGAAADLAALTMSLKASIPAFLDWLNYTDAGGGNSNYGFTLRSGFATTATVTLVLQLEGTPISNNVLAISGATVTSQVVSGVSAPLFTLTLVLSVPVSAGDNPVTLKVNGTQRPNVIFTSFPPAITLADINLTGSTLVNSLNAITPSGAISKIKSPQYGSENFFFIGSGQEIGAVTPVGIIGTMTWTLSDATVKGVWIANTLPMPGRNTFLDQDLPPFVDSTIGSNSDSRTHLQLTAVKSGAGQFDGNTYRTSMKMANATIDPATGNPPADFAIVKSTMAARPAPFPVLRTADLLPFTYGYNKFLDLSYSSDDQNAAAHGGISYAFANVPGDTTAVVIRLLAPGGKKGWSGGTPGYYQPLAENLKIFFSNSQIPAPNDPSTYDFVTTNNQVNIPTDGGGGYLATLLNGGFNIAVQNLNGIDVDFDILIEIQNGAQSKSFFPPNGVQEVFSYCLQETPRTFDPVDNNIGNLPVPQSGYSIFKLRATRLPVKNAAGIAITPASGAQIIATVGQWKLQNDGTVVFTAMLQDDGVTPYTIIIPANARDSGDVAVFWPVLGGNEIVYQFGEQIILEAWADWQPIFQIAWSGLAFGSFAPRQNRAALGFLNYFNQAFADYSPASSQGHWPVVQFPISAALYNDLEELLNLI